MLKEIHIRNFKSIVNEKIELGVLNVFIGENGCGKSNILEALAFASASIDNDKIDTESLYSKGIRVAKPSLFFSSFYGKEQIHNISIDLKSEVGKIECDLVPEDEDDIFSKWFNRSSNTTIQQTYLKSDRERLLKAAIDYVNKALSETNDDKSKADKLRRNFELNLIKGLSEADQAKPFFDLINEYLIFSINTNTLRGIPTFQHSRKEPLGINGENLDTLIADFSQVEIEELREYAYLASWMKDFLIDKDEQFKNNGYRLNRSKSNLYFSDKYMLRKNNIFSSENANEGILHVLFYLSLIISKKTPKLFAIDNIESCLNPHLCREVIKKLVILAKKHNKQLLITTHNPSTLDGLNLNDDEVRLFEVLRSDSGFTKTRRIQFKSDNKPENAKLSELWMKGYLGAISKKF